MPVEPIEEEKKNLSPGLLASGVEREVVGQDMQKSGKRIDLISMPVI